MLDIGPQYWTPIFHNILLIVCLITSIKVYYVKIADYGKRSGVPLFFFFICVFLFLGLRPLEGGGFGDMYIYLSDFRKYKQNIFSGTRSDYLWHRYMDISSKLFSERGFIMSCAFLYVYPLYRSSEMLVGRTRVLLFLMLIASFSFWPYGTNGMRNGIATSLFLWAIAANNWKVLRWGLIICSFMIHGSIIIPIIGYLVSFRFKELKYYFIWWLFTIVISLSLGGFVEAFIYNLGYQDERMNYLVQGNINDDSFRYTGFRWDFLLYSASGVYAGYRYVIRLGYSDENYERFLKIFLVANGLWILVIRANFSNRFAYLSWFLMAIVIFLPILKVRLFTNQSLWLSLVTIAYAGFTYIMYLIS